MTEPRLLEVRDLRVTFDTPEGPLHAVNRVEFTVEEGEVLGLLGESGSGKSATAKSIMGILQTPPGRIVSGEILLRGRDLLKMPAKVRRALMGSQLGWIPQDPLSSLDPTFTIGYQISETLRRHSELTRTEARKEAVALLAAVDLPRPDRLMSAYPHELSGGMRQRVLIAIAIAPKPALLIADEPTTALDVTVQAEIMLLLKALQEERRTGVILITHDSALAGAVADRVAIMYAGAIVEAGPAQDVFRHPAHPYTAGLLRATPSLAVDRMLYTIPGSPPKLLEEPSSCSFADRCAVRQPICLNAVPEAMRVGEGRTSACFEALATVAQPSIIDLFLATQGAQRQSTAASEDAPILRGRDLTKVFAASRGRGRKSPADTQGTVAVDAVDVELQTGETLCVVGESGSGKSTLARLLLGLLPPDSGTVEFRGEQVISPTQALARRLRREIQFVAQDPYSSLDRRMQVGRIVGEGWRANPGTVDRKDWPEAAAKVLASVGIDVPNAVRRLPHEFSGGQRQRIAIARALAMDPSVLVLDEPVSSLDVSVQAQVINLLKEIQAEKSLSYIFITHDLSIVEAFASSVIVMKQGKVVEQGTRDAVLFDPKHEYTRRLLDSSPRWEASGRSTIRV